MLKKNRSSILFGIYLFLICFFLANLEIQIEGPNGWASKLPTWRIADKTINWLYGGKPITGYHLYLTILLLLLFHLPLLYLKLDIYIESKILMSFFVVATIWDLQWFIMNPAFGLKKYHPENIWWFKNWLFGFPREYFLGISLAFIIFLFPVAKGKMFKARLVELINIFITVCLLTFILSIIY
jgi:hypothetical protein